MHCEDNGKLRTPLSEVCMTTDIGCVPIVTGKPTCSPQPDELPIAYDKTTSTLWLFSCDTREWVAHKKFTMDELQDLNLENLNNICSVLKIGVFYNPGTGTIQGNVSLGEFTEQLLKCLDLKTKVVTVTQGENNTIKISIEGLDGLPPTYVKGDNVWFTGTGTEGDPIIVHTYDPICEWPTKTVEQIKAASSKHIGMCVDGESVRVPFTDNIFQEPVCNLPQKTEEQVSSTADKNLIACVDGEPVKVPYPKYQPPVCESNQITLEQAQARGSNLTLVGCDNGNTVRIPVSQSGFFDRDYICVPSVTARPSGAPLAGTGPLRVGCNGELYVWLCESDGSGRWEEVKFNMNSLSNLNVNNVTDLCNNFRMMGWYSNTSGDPCVQEVKLTLASLVAALNKCGLVTETDLARYFNYAFRPVIHAMVMSDGKFTFEDNYRINWDTGIYIKDIVLDDEGFAAYAVHDQRFIVGSGDNNITKNNIPAGGEIDSGEFYDIWVGERYHGLKQVNNPFDRPVTLQVLPGATIYSGIEQPQKYSGAVIVAVTDDPGVDDFKFLCGWHQIFVDGRLVRQSCEGGPGKPQVAKAMTSETYNNGYWQQGGRGGQPDGIFVKGVTNNAALPSFFTIPPNSTKDLYMRMWITWYANRYDANGNPIPEQERIKTLSSGGSWGITGTLQCSMFPQ